MFKSRTSALKSLFVYQQTVTDPSTNQARRRATALIQATVLPLVSLKAFSV